MESSASTARAGFALACALLALALPWPGRRPEALPPAAAARARARSSATRPPGRGSRGFAGPARRLFGLPIDPNCADLVTLETLPGIGPARARAIADERRAAPSPRSADLQRVHGLGPVVGRRPGAVGRDRSLVGGL